MKAEEKECFFVLKIGRKGMLFKIRLITYFTNICSDFIVYHPVYER